MAPKCLTAEQFNNFLKDCKGFDRVLEKVKVVKAENGNCVAELKVEDDHTNIMKRLHGGLSATLVDSITSFALLTYEKCAGIHSVSVDLHLTYVKGAPVGEEIIIHARTLKTGKTLAYLECEIKNKATGELLVKGSQTKFLMQPRATE